MMAVSSARKRNIFRRAMPRMQDAVEAKLYDLLRAHQLGHAYFTGPGMPNRDGQVLYDLLDHGYVAVRRSDSRPGIKRWWITPLGIAYFEINEEHNPRPPAPEPRTLCLLKRVQGSRAKGEVFTTSPGSSYEAEMMELKRRGYTRSRMVMRGHKAGRLSWTITDAGREYIEGLTGLSQGGG